MSFKVSGRIAGLILLASTFVFSFQNCSLDSPDKNGQSSSSSSTSRTSLDIVFQSVPSNVTFYVGGPGIINVVATSTGGFPMTYRWYRNGTELIGQTSSTLSIPSVTMNDGGSYKLVVSNSTGSNFVELLVTISSTPVITFSQQPSPITILAGQNGSLSALAVSTDNQSLSYQWFKDGVALAGFTSPNLPINNAVAGLAGMYYVEVSSTLGPAQKVKSNTVKVTVQGSHNVLAANGCVNGYCACVKNGQLGVGDPASAEAICIFKGYTSLVSFTTSAGIRGAAQCSANGASCFINQNSGNVICAEVVCSR